MIRNALKTVGLLRTALVVGVGILFLLSQSAYAQQPAASPGTQLIESAPGPAAPPAPASAGEASTERVIVTGSYIPTAEEVTASPLDTLTTQDIQRGGSSDVLTTLQKRNPDFTGGANLGSTNANISAGATLGGSSVQIRGFPTLVLYEGRRIADSSAIAAGGFVFSDVGLFPAALIGRIEVLKDGASALYGSEAVGGVVNIFTKDEFQGAEIGFRYGTTIEGAVAERRGYAIAGVGNETTQVTAGMQYLEMDPLFARQRDYSSPSTGGGTTNYSGAVRDATGRFLPIGLDPTNYPGNPVANSPFDVGAVAGSIAPGEGFGALPQFYRTSPADASEVASFDLSRPITSTLDTNRTNAIASFNHKVFGKQLEVFGNFLFSDSSYRSFLNGQPITLGQGLEILGSQRAILVDDDNDPVTPPVQQIVPETRGAPAPFNPFQQSFDSVSAGAGPFRLINAIRFIDRPRIFDNDNTFYRFLGGLRSQINEDWNLETAVYYSKYDISFVNSNLPILTRINEAIAGTGDFEGNPYDPFTIVPVGTGPGQLTQDLFNSLFGTNIRRLSSFQRVFDARVTGFPFELPGGKVGVAFGGEYRLEGFKLNNSPEIFLGTTPVADINKKRDIQSAFAEVNIPIIGTSMNVPGVHNLEISLAGRFDHYEGVQEDAYVPKLALRYQPIKDLTVRFTYSNSFIAPTLFETSGPANEAFSNPINLGSGQEQSQVISGSNPDLTPSTAETYAGGIVYSPSFLPGLTISADFFRTLQTDIISSIGATTIINDVEDLGPASQFANLVAFDTFVGRPGARPVTGPGLLNGNLNNVFVTDVNQNLGGQRIEGFDLSARYNIDFRAAGQLELGVAALVITNYDQKILPIHDEYFNLLGLVGGEGFGAIPEYRINFIAEYRWNGFTLSLNANYIPELLDANSSDPRGDDQDDRTLFPEVGAYLLIDGRLSYTFKGRTTAGAMVDSKDSKSMIDVKGGGGGGGSVPGPETMSPVQKLLDGLTLTVGCNNIFDREPPLLVGANSNTDLSVYDPFGQFVYFEVSKKF